LTIGSNAYKNFKLHPSNKQCKGNQIIQTHVLAVPTLYVRDSSCLFKTIINFSVSLKISEHR